MSGPMTCATAQELAPDLALGTLAGDDRALLLAHVARCPGCEDLLAQLTGVVETLLLLTPEADPPGGFESAVLDRVAASETRPFVSPRRRARRFVVGAAAAVVLVVASVIGTLAVKDTDGRYSAIPPVVATKDLRTATLVGTNGQAWGEAFVFAGRTSWVFIDMRWDVPNGSYTIMLDRAEGPSLAVAGLHLVDGEGSYGHSVGAATDVTTVRITDAAGATVCTAHIRPRPSSPAG
jgi:hypothetical protein